MRNEASNSMNKVSHIISGEDWNLKLVSEQPATRCDVDELRTELIKQGVNRNHHRQSHRQGE
jgi:hypothetical protein